jgi:uncharacterized LabA/DUF88 family protein
MASTNETSLMPSRHIALLIDADNVSAAKLPLILSELAKYGTANIRRAYGDWTSPTLKGWTARLHEYAVRPIQQFGYSKGKNATDIALVIDALELLYTQQLAGFCIASSDADFTPLVMHLRAAGKDVYGFGERKTPEPFVSACTTFLFIDGAPEDVGSVEDAAGTAAKANAIIAKEPAADPTPKKPDRSLAMDTKLVSILRGALAASVREDGWAPMSAAGAAAKRQAPIDPRNHGAKTFTELYTATGLFDVVKLADNRVFVADKRNKDRTPKPTP